ncbi:MAG: MopE-related protein [Myxococcota bacterium]
MPRFAALALLLLACDDGPATKADDTGPAAVDEDGDGWLSSEGDCDDSDGEVHPDAVERCNLADDDCDGQTDEGVATAYWTDGDGDGYGDPDLPFFACAPTDGSVANHDDCDDADAAVNPDAAEVCNGVDDDCADGVDDGLLGSMYADADGDGHGDADSPVESCEEGEGVSALGDDCDDTDAAVFPGADEPDCTDPTDYNCDGSVGYADEDEDGWAACAECDDGNARIRPDANEACNAADDDCDGEIDEPGADGAEVWYWDLDDDGYGDPQASIEVCEPPDALVRDATDCDDADAKRHPGNDETCDGVDEDCDGGIDEDAVDAPTWYADADGDGWGTADAPLASCDAPAGYDDEWIDCDDGDKDAWPGADETCDGDDDDCDGLADEADAVDATVWFADLDGDGFGDPASPALSCDAPAGHVPNADDCDDADGAVSPLGAESCNGVDDDCDGDVDEGAAAGATAWYLDADGDGYGNADVTEDACDAPAGYVADATDCNDGAATASPAGTETCNGLDDDCDGDTDEEGTTTFYKDADGDGWGDESAPETGCTAPADHVSVAGDCDDRDNAVSPSSAEVCDGADNDCDGSTDEAGGTVFYADADGDGYGDAAVVSIGCTAPTGYTTDDSDCDDADPTVSGSVAWYRDADGDGYGTSTTSVTSCTAPTGYVDNDEDCNDASSGYSPAVAETCSDGLDQDCDGTADGGCPDVIEHCGTISSDETWLGEDTHYVTCDVYVHGSTAPLLTIEDGATVEFAPGTGLIVGFWSYGELWIDGHTDGVVLTSDDRRPSAGDWDGLTFGQYDRGSWIEGATIEYGGGNAVANVYVASANLVTVLDSTITDSSVSGVYVTGSGASLDLSGTTVADNASYGVYLASNADLYATGGPTFSGNTITGNGLYPLVVPVAYVPQVTDDLVVSGNGTDRVYVYGGYVTADATWVGLSVPWEINGDVLVEAGGGPRLTLEDGVELAFASGAGLSVGVGNYGELSVEGATEGVTFTSSRTTKRAGDWDGLRFGSYAQYASIAGATIEYGGANLYGNLYVHNTDSTDAVYVADSTIADSSKNGVYVSWYGRVDLDRVTLADNADYGLYVYDVGALNGDDSCPDLVVTGNDVGISLPGQDAGAIGGGSTFSGNVTRDLEVRGDTIVDDTTWQALSVPYVVTGDLSVADSDTPKLILSDGVRVEFETGTGLTVGSSNYGSLIVNGTSTGVTLTSAQAVPAAGDWDGVHLTWSNRASRIDGATIEYGGGNGYGNVYLWPASYWGGTSAITDSTIRYSSNSGVYANDTTDITLSGNTIRDNADDGVTFAGSSELETTGAPTFTDNTITGNGLYPAVFSAVSLAQLDASSTFTGNGTDRVYVFADTITESATWQDVGVPYYFNGDTLIYAASAPTVTIEAGTTLLFNYYAGLHVAPYSYGKLVAIGTSADPIVFTSSQATPAPDDWDGLTLSTYDTGSTLQHVEVSYGGDNGSGNVLVYANSTRVTIADAEIAYSSTWGIYRYAASPTVSGITYTGNTSGEIY